MKNIIKTSAAVAALALATPVFSAEGGFFVEPMVTYEMGDGDVNYPGPVNGVNADVDGFGAGLRLGGHLGDWLFLAADGRFSFPSYDIAGLGDVDAEAWNVGATLGAQMPWLVGLRAWGTWVFAGELDPDAQGLVDANFKGGTGWRAGVGLKLAFASLNVEYQDLTYDEAEINSGIFAGQSLAGVEQDQQSWVWSISFPLSM